MSPILHCFPFSSLPQEVGSTADDVPCNLYMAKLTSDILTVQYPEHRGIENKLKREINSEGKKLLWL
jgi:hypothetical protein